MFEKTICLTYVFLCVVLSSSSRGETQVSTGARYTADWESLKEHNEAPDWFRDAKFGIYFHWGVYSVPAFATEWYPRNMYDVKSREYKHHLEKYGQPSEFGYPDFVPMFTAEKFNADQWAKLFKKSGAQFAGLVAEHHDGFPLYDSDLSEWTAAKMGPRRDVIGELADAVRKEGLIFGASSHRAEHWWFMDGGMDFDSDVQDPEHADFYGPAKPQYGLVKDDNSLLKGFGRLRPVEMFLSFDLEL